MGIIHFILGSLHNKVRNIHYKVISFWKVKTKQIKTLDHVKVLVYGGLWDDILIMDKNKTNVVVFLFGFKKSPSCDNYW